MWGGPSGTEGLELTPGVVGEHCQLRGQTAKAEVTHTQTHSGNSLRMDCGTDSDVYLHIVHLLFASF